MTDDSRIEAVLSNLLRAGVMLAASVIAFGGILYLVQRGMSAPEYRAFHREPVELRTISGILQDAGSFHARGIIQLGLLLLIATPVARVAFSVYAFARERDFQYVLITLIVLGLLFYSLFGNH